MKRQYLYVYTCRRPSGWGRHFGYSGLTNRPDLRDVQHKAKQPWATLIIRRRVIPLGRVPRWLAVCAEYVLIKVTLPVYNVQHNRSNPRRIKPATARRQRLVRDAGRVPVLARARDLVTVLPVLAVVALAFVLRSRW